MKNILSTFLFLFVNILFSQETNTVNSKIDTLTIKKADPIIIKKDTIIYSVESFASKHDDNLEVVLSRMKGVKILPNGEIEVNGKVIRKVLLNNTEVSDLGAAIITRSLSPENIESVTVRLDEKNNKIKESIIDRGSVAILDIKIKKEVKQKLFGKQKLDMGFQDQLKLGGNSNLFSINPKINTHFFVESNNWGKNTIELHNIKNIGEESFAKIFSLPKDIDDIKSRSKFHEELYGFDNFKSNDKSILGVSVNIPLTKKTDLYFGSFNNYNFMKKESSQESFFHNKLIYNFHNYNTLVEYNTKNKIQIKYISDKLKLKSDFNYVYADQNIHSENIDDKEISFHKKYQNNSIYINGEFEYGFTEKLGIYYNTNISIEKFNIKTTLLPVINANFPNYNNQKFFNQVNKNKQTISNNELGVSYKTSKIGTHILGYRYHNNILYNNKSSNFVSFNNNENIHNSNSTLFYKNIFNKDKIELNFGVDFSIIKFPNIRENSYIKKTYFQYDGSITYNIADFSTIKILAQSKVDQFPMQKILNGYVLQDFQTIFITGNNLITPFYNKTYSITYNKDWGNQKGLLIAYVIGESHNLNNQFYLNNYIYNSSDQLDSKYHLFSSSFSGKIKKKFSYRIEPEFIINSSEQANNNLTNKTTVYRFFLGTKLNYSLYSKRIHLYYYPKYSYFLFKDEGNSSVFDFLSNTVNLSMFFIDKKLKVDMGYRQVNFIKNKKHFIDMDMNISYKTSKYKFELSVSNILNQNNFIIQEQDNSILNINNNTVFRRFINLGVEVKI